MSTVTEDDVRPIIRSVSIASGAISFVCAPVPGSDVALLTSLTLGMVTGIAGKFDYVNPIAGILEAKRVIASGAFVGTGALKIATSIVGWIFGVPTGGAALAAMCAANALTAFGSQEYIGWQSYKRFKNKKVTIYNGIIGAVAKDIISPAANELAQDVFDTAVTAVGEMASDESKLAAIKRAASAITPEFKNVLNSVQEIVQSDLVQNKSKVVFGRIASSMAQAATTGKKVDLDAIVVGAIGNEVAFNYFAEKPLVDSEYENTFIKTKLLELKQEMLKDKAMQRLVEELRTKAGKEGKQFLATQVDSLIKKYYSQLKEKLRDKARQ
jgi:hypothetical protein